LPAILLITDYSPLFVFYGVHEVAALSYTDFYTD